MKVTGFRWHDLVAAIRGPGVTCHSIVSRETHNACADTKLVSSYEPTRLV
jgi:hypothetical protein